MIQFIDETGIKIGQNLKFILSKAQIPNWFIPFTYIFGGSFLLIIIPSAMFYRVEHWTILESIYFGKLFRDRTEKYFFNF